MPRPLALKQSVASYDQAVTDVQMEQLLLNIARAHHRTPLHFTKVSTIAATFDFRINAGATPPLGGLEGGFILSPIFGSSLSENPTLTIIPIEGEAFTNRLLTPLAEDKFLLLLRQDADIGILLRLMAEELRLSSDAQESILAIV